MHWELSEEQDLFTTSLREWIAAKFPTDTVRDLAAGASGSFTSALVAEGWWGVGYPEDRGGQGGGALELALASREFGRAAVPNSGWLAAALAAPLLTPEELAAQISGEQRFVPAIRADRAPAWDRLGGTVTGSVPHVLAADEADVFLVPVAGGTAFARVSASDAARQPDNLLDRSRSTATVTFRDAAVLGTVEATPDALARVTNLAAVLVAADALGSAERMLDLAVVYSKQRKQFGQVIGAFQAVKHAAAQMLVTVEAAYSIVPYAARRR